MWLGVIDFSEKHTNIGTIFWATVSIVLSSIPMTPDRVTSVVHLELWFQDQRSGSNSWIVHNLGFYTYNMSSHEEQIQGLCGVYFIFWPHLVFPTPQFQETLLKCPILPGLRGVPPISSNSGKGELKEPAIASVLLLRFFLFHTSLVLHLASVSSHRS